MFGNLGKNTGECKNKHSDKFHTSKFFGSLRRSLEIFRNLRKISEIVAKYLKQPSSIFELFLNLRKLSEAFGILRKISENVGKFSKQSSHKFVNFRKCSKMFRNVRKCSENFGNPRKIFECDRRFTKFLKTFQSLTPLD